MYSVNNDSPHDSHLCPKADHSADVLLVKVFEQEGTKKGTASSSKVASCIGISPRAKRLLLRWQQGQSFSVAIHSVVVFGNGFTLTAVHKNCFSSAALGRLIMSLLQAFFSMTCSTGEMTDLSNSGRAGYDDSHTQCFKSLMVG